MHCTDARMQVKRVLALKAFTGANALGSLVDKSVRYKMESLATELLPSFQPGS